MDRRLAKDPSFLIGVANLVLLLVLLLSTRHPPIESVEASIDGSISVGNATSSPDSPVEVMSSRLAEVSSLVQMLNSRLASLEKAFSQIRYALDETVSADDAVTSMDFHTKAEAEDVVAKLGQPPTAVDLATALATIDSWIAAENDRDALQAFKEEQLAILRTLIAKELAALDRHTFEASSGQKALELHAKAGQILALYPMTAEPVVLEEARTLSSRHAEVGTRIEVIRRQRYNAWAMDKVEEAINAINGTASSFMTSDNPKTIEATVETLGEIDPLLLEPVIAQLYTHAVEYAKSNVSTEQQLELGKRLIDPSLKRKGYGDF